MSKNTMELEIRHITADENSILVPKNKKGSGYVNAVAHHHVTPGYNDEYEVVLQNDSEYVIIEAQYYQGKLFLVVEWLGG